jgi:ATP-dependent RNA helicase RhlE
MTDMGFVSDVSKVVEKLSPNCQFMFFSATINKLSARIAGKASRAPITIDVKETINRVNAKIPENILLNSVYVEKDKKRKALLFLLGELKNQKIIVFTDTKANAEAISKEITQKGFDCACLHSDKTLTQRNYITEKFGKGNVKILVATDIAARGLDFSGLDAVISQNVPSSATLLVHRAGRCGRMGKAGKVFCFCEAKERLKWYEIMNETECKNEIFYYHPFHSDKIEAMTMEEARKSAQQKSAKRQNKNDKKATER